MKATDMPVSILAYTPFSVHIIWILYDSAYGWVTANAVGGLKWIGDLDNQNFGY
jgi:hypothetical protein